jgi:hypothetical protein
MRCEPGQVITDARELWLVQVRLECKGLDPAGRVVRIEGPEPDEIATCAVARFSNGYAVAVDATADDELATRVAALPEGLFFEDSSRAAEAIGRAMGVSKYSTYVFTADMTADPAIVRKGHEDFAVVVDGREVSWASSSRTNSEAAELWVRTDESARRSGHAYLAASAWAAEVTGEGRVAFYSHRDDNHASRRLASKLGARHVFDLVTFTLED